MSNTDQVFGGNSQAMLRGFIDRIEHVNSQIDDLRDDRRVIVAELKAAGFAPKYVARIIRKRKMKPHDRQEDEALESTYMHAAGLATEPPLFRALGALAKDVTSQDKVLDVFKKLVPPEGEIIVKLGEQRMRLWRDSKGEVQSEPWRAPDDKPRAGQPAEAPARRVKPEVPDVDDAGAKALGREYARDNRPVTDNPFPYGDKRRALFDEGWREENGGDGMG